MTIGARVVVAPAGDGRNSRVTIEQVAIPDPGPYEILIKMFASGICHSQLHQLRRPRSDPVILGHEASGTVIARGSQVAHVREGDDVMVTWLPRDPDRSRIVPAAILELGDGRIARSRNVFTWADHTLADEQFVVRLPQGVRRDVTAIVGCAVMTGAGSVLHTARVQQGESLAVIGVGGVGLSAIAAAAIVGAAPIIAVDLDDAKLDFAARFGATIGVNASEVDTVQTIRNLTRSQHEYDLAGEPVAGTDYVLDCVGTAKTIEQALLAARSGSPGRKPGGTAVLVGLPTTRANLDARDLLISEKKLVGSLGGSCRPERDLPMFVRWYQNGKLDLDALVTSRYSLDQVADAIDDLEEGRIKGRAILEF